MVSAGGFGHRRGRIGNIHTGAIRVPPDFPEFTVAPTIRELGIDTLDVEERLAVAHQLFDSVVAELEAEELSDELKAELDRRLALDEADPTRGIPWEKVKADARARRKS